MLELVVLRETSEVGEIATGLIPKTHGDHIAISSVPTNSIVFSDVPEATHHVIDLVADRPVCATSP